MKFINWKRIAAPLALAVISGVLLTANIAQAQLSPEERQQLEERVRSLPPEQQQQIQEFLQNLSPEQLQQLEERYANMTPEQRRQLEERFTQAQGRGAPGGNEGRGQGQRGGGWSRNQAPEISGEDRQRYLMISARITDKDVQNSIIAFVAEQSKQRLAVTEAALELSALLADETASPESISDQQEALSEAAQIFRTWKEGALKELDAKIGYTKNPRFSSLLMLVGILGDEAGDAGGFNAIFPKGVAGDGDINDMVPRPERGRGREGRGEDRRNRDGRGERGGPPAPPAPPEP